MKNTHKNKAFTLIELLIVAAIIGVIQLVVIYTYLNAQKQTRDVGRKSDLAKISTALEMWHADKKEYPATNNWVSGSSNDLNDTLANTILRYKYIDSIPCDPKVSQWNCAHGGHNAGSNPDYGYLYVLKNYNFSGSYTGSYPGKGKYSVFAALEAPSAEDKNQVSKWDAYDLSYKEYIKGKWNFEAMFKVGN
ncbi:MAG: type II secretion system protein [bacterium]